MYNSVVIYYHSACEIWLDNKGGLWQEWSSKRGTTCTKFHLDSIKENQIPDVIHNSFTVVRICKHRK